MVYVLLSTWSLDKTKEVVKVAMELPPIPDYINRKMLVNTELGVGTKCFDIYEFDSSKHEEAIWDIVQPYTQFYDIPGYKYELKLGFKTREVMQRYLESK